MGPKGGLGPSQTAKASFSRPISIPDTFTIGRQALLLTSLARNEKQRVQEYDILGQLVSDSNRPKTPHPINVCATVDSPASRTTQLGHVKPTARASGQSSRTKTPTQSCVPCERRAC